jgi:hypothetical protein
VGSHHAEGLLDTQVKGAAHGWVTCLPRAHWPAPRPPRPPGTLQGRRPAAPPALIARSCRPSGGIPLGSPSSQERYTVLKTINEKQKLGVDPKQTEPTSERQTNGDSASTCFFSASRALRVASAACCRPRTVASCSSTAWRRSSWETLS